MKIINIGILAHVDAGKTTLTESLLYTSGAIAEQGNVDKGTTRTDTLILERQRGITLSLIHIFHCLFCGLAEMHTDDIGCLADLLSDSRASGGVNPSICRCRHSFLRL